MNISFIGGGLMAEALIGGILEAKITTPDSIRVGEPVEARRDYLEQTYSLKAYASNLDLLSGADLLVFAVKPQSLPSVLPELKGNLDASITVVSIMAGVTSDTLVDGLGHDSVVRVMPNTPAQIGQGMSVWTALPSVPQDKIKATGSILETLGEEWFVPEEKYIDMATAVSASGPAYVFLFIESIIDAGVNLGMPRDMARKLVLQTVIGSSELVKQTGKHPAELKDMVTSPGGTTIAALAAFEEAGFRAGVFDAVQAAFDKSVELGKKH